MYTIITDGAYSSIRNQGGVGIIILDQDGDEVLEYSKTFINTTNNQMEMLACIIGMESISEPEDITIITDSQYVIGCATLGWKRKKNIELWERFDKAMGFHKSVKFEWVKGHSNNPYNIRCDKLAVVASQIKL
ncbi:ribonuclease H family protein [Intestinibacter sp.]|uniref:ribonuclease H family protein n=1 Tax=Intestinibacter sp. TaxID=1965304 RepID=UPI003F15F867